MAFSKIRVLGESLINKIAAGEVIESSASIVKELLDNALDAKATRIRVDVRAGGKQLIRVSDDGCGMSEKDCLLCFERHATSKIFAFEDLTALSSCGFRGEALAAIAAVSKVLLISSDGSSCHQVRIEGGKVIDHHPDSRQRGTSVEVTSLFYNTPVRAGFGPSLAKESADIAAIFTQVALANPDVGFELWKNGGEIFSLPPCSKDLKAEFALRIEQLLGRAFAENLLFFQCGQKAPKLWGYLANPTYDRPNRSGQYLSINSRPIQSSPITAAIAQGYGARLAPRRFPCFVLNGYLPPEDVDFNVHPQKKEIRLKRAGRLLHWISSSVDGRFLQTFSPSDEQILPPNPPAWEQESSNPGATLQKSGEQMESKHLPFSPNEELAFSPLSTAESLIERKPLQRICSDLTNAAPRLAPFVGFASNDRIWDRVVKAIWSPYLLLDPAPLAQPGNNAWWAVHQKGGWLMIDYPKAAAWVHAERALADHPAARQLLMQPLQLFFSRQSAELVSARLGELEVWGLSLARTAAGEFACLAIPQTLECSARTIAECLEQWARLEQSSDRARFMARWLAGQPWRYSSTISGDSAAQLIQKVLQSPQPPRTARGDAISSPLFRDDLAKFFKSRG